MAGRTKPHPIEVFRDSMSDAERLVLLAEAFTNTRVRRMRRELRHKIGSALGIAPSSWDDLDCAESGDVFAHEADRIGRRRASITVDDVRRELKALRAIVEAIEQVLGA